MINFEVNQQAGKKISAAQWDKWFKKISKALKLKKRIEVSVGIVGDRRIQSLNAAYRRKDKVTDVLSFGERDVKMPFSATDGYIGEIIICYPQAVRQARRASRAVSGELEWLLVHGFLHLLGYDHQTDKQEAEMKTLEQKIMATRL